MDSSADNNFIDATSSHLYNLSCPKRESMDNYISNSLATPLGLTNAPAVFQGLINDLLHDMLNHFVFVYLDDILIFSQTLDKHVQQVGWVLQRLLENKPL